MTKDDKATKEDTNAQQKTFAIQQIYAKDISFESPNPLATFNSQEATQPKINIELNNHSKKVKDDLYEVELDITVNAIRNEKIAFLVELKQAGLFKIDGFNDDDIAGILGVACPEILFPYAREAVANILTRGGFPPLHIAPINFSALYQQQQAQQKEKSN